MTSLRSFAAAFDAADPDAAPLLPDFRSEEVRRSAVRVAEAHPGREALVAALLAQTVPRGPKALQNLRALGEPGVVAVVTGQQAGLFGGPLLTTYKIQSAIAVARALAAETGATVVPVFWLQNEDHDFREIAECFLPTSRGALRRAAIGPEPDDGRVSVAHRLLDVTLDGALSVLDEALGDFPGAADTAALLRRAYRPGVSVSDAFASLIGELFEPDGLVIVDSRHPGIAALAAPLHRRALVAAPELAAALSLRAERIERAGFSVQVHVRAGAPLAFFHPDGAEGPRYRLEPAGQAYGLVGETGRVTEAEILAVHAADPRVLSTSALLRPLVQDTLLPTAAYVGGPAELSYLAQTEPLYRWAGRSMPLIVPRARFRIVEERSSRLLSDLGLTADELALSREVLLGRLADGQGQTPSAEALRGRLLDPFRTALAALEPAVASVDPTLVPSAQKLEAAVAEHVDRFAQRYARARAGRDQVAGERLDRVLALLQPNGVPQERVHSLPYYLARYPARFLEATAAAVIPYSGALQEVCL